MLIMHSIFVTLFTPPSIQDGTAPMAEFADVFDPSGDPQKAMVGMMQVRTSS